MEGRAADSRLVSDSQFASVRYAYVGITSVYPAEIRPARSLRGVGGGSVKRNGCYDDIVQTLTDNGIPLAEYGDSSREFAKLVQLSAGILGDRNRMSYDAGISYIRNVFEATRTLQKNPDDLDARGIIMMGASLSTSSRLGIGKEEPFAYEIYELEFLPEKLFGSSYRRSLTSVFPRFLQAMGKHHADDIRKYYHDAFGFDSSIEESSRKLVELFEGFGVEMYYDGKITREQVDAIPCHTELSKEEVFDIINSLIR